MPAAILVTYHSFRGSFGEQPHSGIFTSISSVRAYHAQLMMPDLRRTQMNGLFTATFYHLCNENLLSSSVYSLKSKPSGHRSH